MKKIFIFFVIFAVMGVALYSQSLENNEFYKQSVEYANMSQKAIDDGDYALAQEYALESQKYAALSKQYIEDMLLAYRARSSYVAAKARMDLANRINLKNNDPELYAEASEYFVSATGKYNAQDFANSLPDSRMVVELLKNIDPAFVPRQDPVVSQSNLAAFYSVKLNTNLRDCLWRIAGLSYVYGDPYQWTRLYEANKDKFPERDNPDLIEPGMILSIPSIKGEVRSGTR